MKKLFENWNKFLKESEKAKILDDLADAERKEAEKEAEEKEEQEEKDEEQDKALKNASRKASEMEIMANTGS